MFEIVFISRENVYNRFLMISKSVKLFRAIIEIFSFFGKVDCELIPDFIVTYTLLGISQQVLSS